MKNEQVLESGTSRRALLIGVGSVGAVSALAACGTESDSTGTGTGSGSGSGSEPTTAATTGGADAGAELTKTADIPVQGGKIFEEQGVVVTQPSEGNFKCFSNICTHQGCPVTNVEGGTINCRCHNSSFSIEDGSPTAGPANKPLEEKTISVEGDAITLSA